MPTGKYSLPLCFPLPVSAAAATSAAMLWRAARILSAGLFAWKDDVGECLACCEEVRGGGMG